MCSLCNYSTHLLYHLPFLSHIDTFDISNGHLQKLAEVIHTVILSRNTFNSYSFHILFTDIFSFLPIYLTGVDNNM